MGLSDWRCSLHNAPTKRLSFTYVPLHDCIRACPLLGTSNSLFASRTRVSKTDCESAVLLCQNGIYGQLESVIVPNDQLSLGEANNHRWGSSEKSDVDLDSPPAALALAPTTGEPPMS